MASRIIDMQVQLRPPGDPYSEYFLSKGFYKGITFLAIWPITGVLFGKINIERVKQHILGIICRSKSVCKAVILANDRDNGCLFRVGVNPS
jgi:hypothetical protein